MTIRSSIAKSTLAIAIALGGIVTPALAASDEAPTININAKGYDLSTPDGVAKLTKSVHLAAHKLCAPNGDDKDLGLITEQRRCYEKAVASADTQIAALRSRRQGSSSQVASVDTGRSFPPVTK